MPTAQNLTISSRQDMGGCLRKIFDPVFWKESSRKVSGGGYRWSLPQLAYTAMAMGLSTEPTLRDRFTEARALTAKLFCKRHRPGRSYQGFADALRRVGPSLPEQLRGGLQGAVLSGFQRWKRLSFSVDGTRRLLPHTGANVEAFGETRIKNRTQSAPQLLVAAAVHLESRVLWDWEIAGGQGSEPDLAARLIQRLPLGALAIKDAGTVSAEWIGHVLQSRRHLLMRVAGNFRLWTESVREAARRGGSVWLWCKGDNGQPPVKLRLIVLQRQRAAQRKGRQRQKKRVRKIYLVTDLSPAELSDAEAGRLYFGRWGANEIGFRSWKQVLDARKALARSPEMAVLETSYSLLGLQALQVLQFLAAGPQARLGSLAATWRVWRQAAGQLAAGRCAANFGAALKKCVVDGYQRRRPKQRRRAAQKKRADRLRPPVFRKLTKAIRLAWERNFHEVG